MCEESPVSDEERQNEYESMMEEYWMECRSGLHGSEEQCMSFDGHLDF